MCGKILKNNENTVFDGCDFVVQLPEERKNIKILQITDMQIIDATQRRTPERLRSDEIEAWDPANFDIQCGDHIRSLVAQSDPDLIFITGDIVYGSFDDKGTTLLWLCELMDSFEIPWAPVFGNHDNESLMGVAWQCEQLEKSRFCLFRRGEVSGNGNYTVGVAIGDELVRVLHMLDSNGCCAAADPAVIKEKGIYPDQIELVRSNTARIRKAQGKEVPAFAAFHIPVAGFKEAEFAKGYRKTDDDKFTLGVDVPAKDGDFGFCHEWYSTIETEVDFIPFLNSQNIDGVFVGHAHSNCTSISYRDIKWVFGFKTGQYDYHVPGQLGGTLITQEGDSFSIYRLASLAKSAPMPIKCSIFDDFFAMGEFK